MRALAETSLGLLETWVGLILGNPHKIKCNQKEIVSELH